MQAVSELNPELKSVSTETHTPRVALTASGGVDWALLCLRLCLGLSLFLKHGWEKPTHFAQMAQHFPNPLHVGSVPSLLFALTSDAICSILVVLGVATRWVALFIFANIFIAWSFVHHFQFFGRGADHGEAMVLYLGGFLSVAIAGPGRFSLDHMLQIQRRLGTGRRSEP